MRRESFPFVNDLYLSLIRYLAKWETSQSRYYLYIRASATACSMLLCTLFVVIHTAAALAVLLDIHITKSIPLLMASASMHAAAGAIVCFVFTF
jgi:hypothetical protein